MALQRARVASIGAEVDGVYDDEAFLLEYDFDDVDNLVYTLYYKNRIQAGAHFTVRSVVDGVVLFDQPLARGISPLFEHRISPPNRPTLVNTQVGVSFEEPGAQGNKPSDLNQSDLHHSDQDLILDEDPDDRQA